MSVTTVLHVAERTTLSLGTGILIATTFSASEITAIAVALVALITAIFTGIVNIITVMRAERKVDAVGTAVAEVQSKAEVIVGHVNSSATANAAKIEALQRELQLMRQLFSDQKETAALLAQGTVSATAATAAEAQARVVSEALHAIPPAYTTPTAPRANEVVLTNGVAQSLDNIDANTAAIEKNTAKTDATVQDMKDHQKDRR